MRVLIVAKTRMGKGACIGGIAQDGKSVRLISAHADAHDGAGREYEVGEVWEVEAKPATDVIPPHVENIIVYDKHKCYAHPSPISIIERFMSAKVGGLEALYEGLTQSTPSGALYIAERTGVPSYSTMFWRPDRPLTCDTDGKRVRYRYPTEDGGYTLTFVGFQDPLETIPTGTLLRVSLAHWWRPDESDENTEYRCFVQLSGWFLEGLQAGHGEERGGEEARGRVSIRNPLPTLSFGHPSKEGIEIRNRKGERGGEESSVQRPANPSGRKELQQVLKDVFGYDEFRPLQRELIENILQRRDTLVIMPTGGGKSLCYQLPALLWDSLTVVVSPLISLMQDQVTQLQQLGIPAVYLNSTLSHSEYVATANRVRRGEIKLLYIAPETLLRPETLLMLDRCRLDCLAIDEAHCISQWGHDFRPEYRQLAAVRQRFPHAVCVAFTATATPPVQADIKQTLGFRDENEFIASFDRENLFIAVEPKTDLLRQTLDFLTGHRDQSGIIYCATQQQVDSLHAALVEHGIRALPYHAGLDSETRKQNQIAFSRDDVPVMVATIAFGMGIDKPDVRFVLHVDLPKNIECYYQEIGRAGRDGLRADCLLLFSYGDVGTIQHFIRQGAPSEREGRLERLQALVDWAMSEDCRRHGLLAYFGEQYEADNCQMCDNCLKGESEQIDLTIPAQKFLSCVVRTDEVFGINHIIDVLRGSRAKKVRMQGHDKLSTYGIGKEYAAEQWKLLAQQFLQQKLLERDMEFGSVRLTEKGRSVLKGEKVWGTPVIPSTYSMPDETTRFDVALFGQLRIKRKALADAEGVPPYAICSDRALQEMATYFPHSAASFEKIHGIGRVKVEKYADIFLPIVCAYCQEHGRTEQPKLVHHAARSHRPAKSRSQEVGERFQAGESIAELMQVYEVKRQTIVSHLDKYVQSGNQLPVERLRAESLLSAAMQDSVLATFDKLGLDRLRPVFDAFNETIGYDELCLMRAIYRSQTAGDS